MTAPQSPPASKYNYEPRPRCDHVSCRVGTKVLVKGGYVSCRVSSHVKFDEAEVKQSVVEVFDIYQEEWERRKIEGDVPSPPTHSSAYASFCNDIFLFGGERGSKYYNTLHKLDTTSWHYSLLSPEDVDGAPMAKCSCGMVSFGDRLGILGGYGVPNGSMEPQEFLRCGVECGGDRFTKSGWTNEFHIYSLSSESWSCPVTTGQRPPPCSGFTFTAINSKRAVMFGGYNGERGHMNDVYIFNLSTSNWSKMKKAGPWPGKRAKHAACCLNYGQRFPQLLITEGVDGKVDKKPEDMWILDVDRAKWRKEECATLRGRYGHSLTAISLGHGLTEVVEFGGRLTMESVTAETTLLQFRQVESSPGEFQWKLVSVVDNQKRGSQKRMMEKYCFTAQNWQQYISGDREIKEEPGSRVNEAKEEKKSDTLLSFSPQAFADLPRPNLLHLMEVIGVDLQSKWRDIGLGLGLENSALKTMKMKYREDTQECMLEVFSQWEEGGTSDYSWQTLAKVLCSRIVDKPGLLPIMFERIRAIL